MIVVPLPRVLTDEQVACLRLLAAKHHGEEDGHVNQSPKPHHLPEIAAQLDRAIKIGRVDPHMQVYRLAEGESVPLHRDDDFPGPGGKTARFSILVRLNDDYEGGHTLFDGKEGPSIPVGAGWLFSHCTPHEGRPTPRGEKLVLKTDLFV